MEKGKKGKARGEWSEKEKKMTQVMKNEKIEIGRRKERKRMGRKA